MLYLSTAHAAISLYLKRRAAASEVRHELSILSDAELNDIGISRWAIDDVARQAAEKIAA